MKAFNRSFFKTRFQNQLSNLITTGSLLFLMTLGIFVGAGVGVQVARWINPPYSIAGIQAGIVFLSILVGLVLSLLFSYSISPWLIQASFRAKKCALPSANEALSRSRLPFPHLQIKLFEVDETQFQHFGHNVVVSGLPCGQGWLSPAIFASKGVLHSCPPEELSAIFAHEISHLTQWHLFKRVKKSLLTFFGATFFMVLILMGLQWSGYTQSLGLLATLSGVIPALLTWRQNQQEIKNQEKEADALAIRNLGANAHSMISALERLSKMAAHPLSPLVSERIQILKKSNLAA